MSHLASENEGAVYSGQSTSKHTEKGKASCKQADMHRRERAPHDPSVSLVKEAEGSRGGS